MNNIKKITEVLKLNDYPDIPQYSAESLRRERVIIYGAGSGFITLSMFVLDRFKITPEVVLDKKFSSAENINGIFFCSPDDFAPPPEILTQALVIITIGSPQIRSTIQKHLTEKGFSKIISAMDIYEYHLPAPAEKLTTQGFDFYKSNEKKIIQAFELFADEKSREIFSSYLFTHLFRNSVAIPHEQPANQYFPFELWDKSTYRRSIICGAYNGDTALKTAQNAQDIEAMACLEPDPENFKSLTDNTKQLKNIIRELLLLPLGVYKENIQLHFAANNKSNSAISHEGNLLIQCVALDLCLPDFEPSFISMDIEGAEFDALQGMKEIIKKHHPKLAVCVYHSPDHIWTIPQFLHELVPEYKFYLRNYTGFTSETVLYAK